MARAVQIHVFDSNTGRHIQVGCGRAEGQAMNEDNTTQPRESETIVRRVRFHPDGPTRVSVRIDELLTRLSRAQRARRARLASTRHALDPTDELSLEADEDLFDVAYETTNSGCSNRGVSAGS